MREKPESSPMRVRSENITASGDRNIWGHGEGDHRFGFHLWKQNWWGELGSRAVKLRSQRGFPRCKMRTGVSIRWYKVQRCWPGRRYSEDVSPSPLMLSIHLIQMRNDLPEWQSWGYTGDPFSPTMCCWPSSWLNMLYRWHQAGWVAELFELRGSHSCIYLCCFVYTHSLLTFSQPFPEILCH